jgi:HlyD family secretion protein
VEDSDLMEREFSPALLAAVRERPSPLPRVVGLTVCAFLLFLIAGAAVGRLDVVARAQGTLVPKSRLQVVQPVKGGRIAEILVREGQKVAAGQVLVKLDGTVAASEIAALRRELRSVRLGLARVSAELADGPLDAPNGIPEAETRQTRAQLRANRDALSDRLSEQRATIDRLGRERAAAVAEQARLESILPLLKEDSAAYQRLAEAGNAGRVAARKRRRDYLSAKRKLAGQRETIRGLDSAIEEARARLKGLRSKRRSDLHAERVELRQRRTALEKQLAEARYRSENLTLKAPRSGVVQSIATHTLGSVVPTGTTLVSLVPEGEPLRAELRISNSDTGFVRAGQTARLKLAAYPFQRFGTVDAKVVSVSPTAETGENRPRGTSREPGHYIATLALENQQLSYEGEVLRFKPGMQVTGEVKLGERSVLEYVLSPIEKVVDYAGKER